MDDSKILITGGNGQLGQALSEVYPDAIKTDANDLDITSSKSLEKFNWQAIEVIINAAGYTNVDGAETPDGKKLAWLINDEAVGNLASIATDNKLLLVHISTAYVFNGLKKMYQEEDPVSPLGEYAKSKAAGDQRVTKVPKHYIVRTDSVIGDGKNFVRTMLNLAEKGIAPHVVSDQIIRPTFTSQLADGIKFLINKTPDYGVYNLTNEGEPISWANFTRAIFKEASVKLEVSDITYQDYSAGKSVAPRPLNSVLDLAKIETTGFKPGDWPSDLADYVKKELSK